MLELVLGRSRTRRNVLRPPLGVVLGGVKKGDNCRDEHGLGSGSEVSTWSCCSFVGNFATRGGGLFTIPLVLFLAVYLYFKHDDLLGVSSHDCSMETRLEDVVGFKLSAAIDVGEIFKAFLSGDFWLECAVVKDAI